mmetsp:Transcript_93715/g.268590  ORF Transcript_93715/g.268590 Transcript_93715/m.268590 type:complete len:104 (+) Transcript_93715:1172-1483(+)
MLFGSDPQQSQRHQHRLWESHLSADRALLDAATEGRPLPLLALVHPGMSDHGLLLRCRFVYLLRHPATVAAAAAPSQQVWKAPLPLLPPLPTVVSQQLAMQKT